MMTRYGRPQKPGEQLESYHIKKEIIKGWNTSGVVESIGHIELELKKTPYNDGYIFASSI